MLKRIVVMTFVILSLLFLCAFVEASGVLTFQIEVLPGVTISSPGLLDLGPVAPGVSVEREVEVTVWSNVEWELAAQVLNTDSDGLEAKVEVFESGTWRELTTSGRIMLKAMPIAGAEGTDVQIPFRVTSSHDNTPGNYSLQVEFTVVPSL